MKKEIFGETKTLFSESLSTAKNISKRFEMSVPVILVLFFLSFAIACSSPTPGSSGGSRLPKFKKKSEIKPDSSMNKQNIDSKALAGLYKSTSPALLDRGIGYFIICADDSFYFLRKDQATFYREYKGETPYMQFDFKANKFDSGNVEGVKIIDAAEIPEPLKLIVSINDAVAKHLEEFNNSKITIKISLAQKNPAFTKIQTEMLIKLLEDKNTLVNFMKKNDLDTFIINDYTNSDPYIRQNKFTLPSGLDRTSDANEILKWLRTESNIDVF